jgi:hypothetical protein
MSTQDRWMKPILIAVPTLIYPYFRDPTQDLLSLALGRQSGAPGIGGWFRWLMAMGSMGFPDCCPVVAGHFDSLSHGRNCQANSKWAKVELLPKSGSQKQVGFSKFFLRKWANRPIAAQNQVVKSFRMENNTTCRQQWSAQALQWLCIGKSVLLSRRCETHD